jgi:uncharacterized phage protein (TIGR02216 family)
VAEFAAGARRLAGFAGAALGWSAERFWTSTPEELAAVIEALTGGQSEQAPPLERSALARLMEAFPDGR